MSTMMQCAARYAEGQAYPEELILRALDEISPGMRAGDEIYLGIGSGYVEEYSEADGVEHPVSGWDYCATYADGLVYRSWSGTWSQFTNRGHATKQEWPVSVRDVLAGDDESAAMATVGALADFAERAAETQKTKAAARRAKHLRAAVRLMRA